MLKPFLAFGLFLALLYFLSKSRKSIDWRLVFMGIAMQFLGAILVLKVPVFKEVFAWIAHLFGSMLAFSEAGAKFVFGDLAGDGLGYILAFRILPTIIFFSALSSILFYLGVLQRVILGFSWLMRHTLRLSGAESLALTANVFVGQTEAPLLVKPYLTKMTLSELLCLMSGGMATIAGGVFAAYIGFLGGDDPALRQFFATHLLSASLISAPAAVVCAKMLIPETSKPLPHTSYLHAQSHSNLLEAIASGTTDGLKLAVNVGAMLLVFTALVYMINSMMIAATDQVNSFCNLWFECGNWNQSIKESTKGGFEGFNLSYLLGLLFAPLAWLLDVPPQDVLKLGQLLGQKTVINEFYAYSQISSMELAPRTKLIATYALCGFANFASVGIQIGGIGALVPEQKTNLARLGMTSLLAGTLACLMTAAVAAVLL
jgi:CNT family concentrative nucleoside transporter